MPRHLSARADAWKAFLALGIVLTAGYFMLPSAAQQDIYYQLPEMLAATMIVVGVSLHRPRRQHAWYLLAAGLVLTAAGDWTWVILDRIYGLEPFPSVADVFYLTGMATIAGAVWAMLHGRVPGGDRAGVLDGLIVTVGAGLLTWVFLMAPIAADSGQSPAGLMVALAYPLIDLLLLGALVRLVVAPGEMVMSLRLVIAAFLAYLLADFPYAILALNGDYATGSPVDAGWLLGAVLWGTAALHPSMRNLAEPVENREQRLAPWRLAMLATASLMAPAVLLGQWVGGWQVDVPVVATGSIVLFLLVIARLQGVVTDLRATLDERSLLQQELEHRALHDPLTGLANRTLFHQRLTHALTRRQGSVAVLFLDLDDFKTVNDSYGHATGDRLLRSVASALTTALRPEDTVARLGGDEFAVLLEDSPDQYTASQVAGRLLTAVQSPSRAEGRTDSIGVSIGISLGIPAPAAPAAAAASAADDLMRDADIAMYVAKGQGKGTFTVFEPTEHSGVVRGLELRNDLDRAIRERQFKLEYQPILDLGSGEVAGVEALVRWHHPTLGLLLPEEFIPLAEATAAIVPLGSLILHEACRVAAKWGGPFVSVNVSAVQLGDPGLLTDVQHALVVSGLPPQRLVLEVTESARLEGQTAAAAVDELDRLGVRMAIDDFGTGFAALSQLSHRPFEIVKMDGSFMTSIATDERADALVTGILDLARRMGVVAVAEGIEDGVQLARLRAAGCPLGQGFHLAQPMSERRLRRFLSRVAPHPVPAPAAAKPAQAHR